MQQLTGMDASFLYLETPGAPTHIASLAIYDQSSAPGGRVTFKGILKNVERRLHLARCFRQKVVHVPLDLDHPYWLEDPDFDLEFHIRHIALPHPGDWRQLCIQVARLQARPLDVSKPLWEMYIIEGLDSVAGVPEGSFAVFTKIHHAAIDGVSGAELIAAIHDLAPDAVPPPPTTQWKPEAPPTALDLMLRTTINNLTNPLRFARTLARTAPGLATLLWPDGSEDIEETGPVPRTRFNGNVSPHRVVEGRVFSLQEIREIRRAVPGSTVNDVVLTVCGGALRRYLKHHHELPKSSLVAMAPISVRSDQERGAAGNRVSGMAVTLFTTIADPLQRLQKMQRETRRSKATAAAVGARTMTDITQFVPGLLAELAARLYSRLGLANRIRPFLNTVITNVPGPQIPLYFTGARMVALYGLAGVMDGMGLVHPVFSYDGRITISITACRRQMPDPEFYAACLQTSYDELLRAARRAHSSAAPADTPHTGAGLTES